MATMIRTGLSTGVLAAEKPALMASPPMGRTIATVTSVRFPAKIGFRVVACAAAPSSSEAKRKPRGIMKPQRITPVLEEFVGGPEISRTQALKLIWTHIKSNNLQDPNDKKIIVCDEKLKKVFGGKDRVGFLEISGLISPHFLKS